MDEQQDIQRLILDLHRFHVFEHELAKRLVEFGMEALHLDPSAGSTPGDPDDVTLIRAELQVAAFDVSSPAHHFYRLVAALMHARLIGGNQAVASQAIASAEASGKIPSEHQPPEG